MGMKKKDRRRRTFLLEDWVTDLDTGKQIHIGITDGKVYIDGRAKYQLRAADIVEEEDEEKNNGQRIIRP